MKPNPLVTVIIPSYNHAKYIEQAIESVLIQTYSNIQLIVSDDGSADNTHDLLREKYSENASIELILNKKNKGQSAVINQALEQAKGEFIAFLPSDDWYLPSKIELQIEKFRDASDKTGAVYSGGYRYFEDTDKLEEVNLPMKRGEILENLILDGNFVYPVTPLFKRSVFDKIKFDESYTAQGEAVFLLIAIYFEFDFIDEPLAVMRDHSYNTGKQNYMLYKEVLRSWEEFFNRDDIPENIKSLKKHRIKMIHRTRGFQFLGEERDFKMARKAFKRAISTDISEILRPKVTAAFLLSMLPPVMSNYIIDRYFNRKAQ